MPVLRHAPLLATCAWLAIALTACDQDPHARALDDGEGAEPGSRPAATALGSNPDPVGAAEDCCAPDTAPGCSDLAVQACVCAADSYCCETAWDSVCVTEVASLDCGTCETTAVCCTAQTTPGCEDDTIRDCVCAADWYCCETAWDSLCVTQVTSLGCGSCHGADFDLVITDLELPPTACPGEDIAPAVSLQVTNVGGASITTTFHVGWYLSSDTTLDAGDRLLLGGRDQVASLGASSSTSVSLGVNQIPGDATPGAQYIIVKVDELEDIAETDELNNTLAIPIVIQPECAAANEWARGLGGTQAEAVEPGGAVAVDAEGNTYILGLFHSPSLDLGAGPQARQGDSDLFLVSYDADGLYRWSQRLGGDGWDYTGGVGVDAAGNVYVAGESEGSLDLGGGALPGSGGTRDLFVASYTGAGVHRWSQRHGGPGASLLTTGLAVDETGRLVVVGRLEGAVSLGGAPLSDAGDTDMFVLALDAAGAHRWSRALGGPGGETAAGVAVDASGGAVVAGSFSGSANFGSGSLVSAGSSDGVIVRLDATGTTQWARRYGSTGSDAAHDVVLDATGNAYVLGTFSGTVNLGDGARVAGGLLEVLLASYDASGTLRWSRRGGGAGLDYARGLDLDADGHPVAIGSFFGSSAELGGPALAGAGGYDTWYASFTASTGAHRWSSRLGTSARDEGYDLAVSPSGALVLAGIFDATLSAVGTTLVGAGQDDVFIVSVQP